MFKDLFACKKFLAATHHYSEKIQRPFRLQNCLSRKSSISWKYSKTFSPAKLSQQQPIIFLTMFKNFFACKIVVAANQRYPEKFKDFSACKIVLAATHQYSENVQKLFRLQNCRSRKSAISWKHSKIFPPAKMSQPQSICILDIFKDFFGCKDVLAATHHSSEKIQSLFRLQNCLSRKSSISWKYSKTFSAAKLSQPQIFDILEIFQDVFGCKFVLAANHLYPGNIQKLFRLQNCLSSNPS